MAYNLMGRFLFGERFEHVGSGVDVRAVVREQGFNGLAQPDIIERRVQAESDDHEKKDEITGTEGVKATFHVKSGS
jgi:hypothetical protein